MVVVILIWVWLLDVTELSPMDGVPCDLVLYTLVAFVSGCLCFGLIVVLAL